MNSRVPIDSMSNKRQTKESNCHYLKGVGKVHDSDFAAFAKEHNKTEFEYWEPTPI